MGNVAAPLVTPPPSSTEDGFHNNPSQSALTSSVRSLTPSTQNTASATDNNNDSNNSRLNFAVEQSPSIHQSSSAIASSFRDNEAPRAPSRKDLYSSASLRSIHVQGNTGDEDTAHSNNVGHRNTNVSQQAAQRRRVYQQIQQQPAQILWTNTVDELSTLITNREYQKALLYLARDPSLIPVNALLYIDELRQDTKASILQRALLDGAPEILILALIERGKEPLVSLKDIDGHTATHYIYLIRSSSVMKELVRICGKEIFLEVNDYGYSPLHTFLQYNAVYETIKFVLDECPVIKGTNLLRIPVQSNGYLPLHIAVSNHASYEVIKLLLERDRDDSLINFNAEHFSWTANEPTKEGSFAIHIALSYNLSLRILELLIEKGGTNQLYQKSMDGWIPIHIALSYNLELPIIKLLVEKGGTEQLQQSSAHGFLPIHTALASNTSLEVVKYMVEHGGKETLRKSSENGSLPIHIAASNTKTTVDLIQYLIEAGGKETLLQQGTEFELNALGFALSNNLTEDIVSYLIAHGGIDSIQQKRKRDGILPIHVALFNDPTIEIVRLLCECYNDDDDDNVDYYEGYTAGGRGTLRQPTSNGWCAIHYAVYYGCDPEIVRFIHEFGGKDIFYETDFDNVSATYSAWYGSILSNEDVDETEEYNNGVYDRDTLLNFVINKQGDEIMKYLNRKNIPEESITSRDNEYQRSILQRALNENAPYFIVEKMIEVGGEKVVSIKDSEMNNPLHYINDANSIDTVKLLLEKCGNEALYEKNVNGYLPLHSLIRTFASTVALKLFLQKGDKETLGFKDNRGWIPLHHAVSIGGSSLETIQFLVEHGGEQTLLLGTNDDWTPLSLAIYNKSSFNVIKYLVAKDVDKGSLIKANVQGLLPIHCAFLAVPKADIDVISLLIEEGGTGSIREKDDFGYLPIHYACREKTGVEPIKLLVEKSGKGMLKQQTNEGWLPIHFAAMTDSLDVIQYIVEEGGKYILQTKTNDGSLPIHIAMQHCKSFKVIKYILDEGGMETLRVEDNGGWLASHIAFNYGQGIEVYKYMIKNGDNSIFLHQNEFYATPLELLYNGRKDTHSITNIHNLILEKGLAPSDCSNKTIMATLKWVNSLDARSEDEVVRNDLFVKLALNDKFTKGRATVFFVLLDIVLQATVVGIFSFVVDLWDSEKNKSLVLPLALPCLAFFALREVIEMHSTPVRVYAFQATNLVDLIQSVLLMWLIDSFVRGSDNPSSTDETILLLTTGFLWLNLLFKLGNIWYPLSMLVAALIAVSK